MIWLSIQTPVVVSCIVTVASRQITPASIRAHRSTEASASNRNAENCKDLCCFLHGLKYTVAYRETEGTFYRDADNSPHAITETLNFVYEHEQFSHELQLTGDALDDRLSYVAGLYYLEEEGTDYIDVPIFLPSPDLAVGFPAAVASFSDVDNSSKAAYVQVSWDLTEMFSVTGGVRYTKDKKNYVYTAYLAGDIDGSPLPFFSGAVNEDGIFRPGLAPLIGNGSGDSNFGLGFHEANYNRPMQYGLTVRYRF